MREILFKGKRTDNKQWVEGFYVLIGEENPSAYIIQSNGRKTRVAHKSISEYTGICDKNGTKIFEGDIVKHFNESNEGYDIGVIYWDVDFVGWRRTTKGLFHKFINTYKLNPTCKYEVIGNIHDNPELLKGGAE